MDRAPLLEHEAPTIPAFARQHKTPRRTMFRRLMTMHGKDRDQAAAMGQPFVPWLFRYAHDGRWRINLTRLRASHPEIFSAPSPRELEDRINKLESRVDRLEDHQRT